MEEIPHRKNMHPQKVMHQGMIENHFEYAAKSHPRRG
jgi:hypothetical protein